MSTQTIGEVPTAPSARHLIDALNALVLLIEQQCPGMRGSVLVLSRDGRLRHAAAPNLPDAYNKAIDGVAIGPNVGSCGTAAFEKQQVIVTDIQNDMRWADYRELAATHGLAACWSTPIFSTDGDVLGTFAMYYGEPRKPAPEDERYIQAATMIATALIERARAEEERELLLAHFATERTLFETMLRQMPAGIVVADAATGKVVLANERAVRILGVATVPEDAIAQFRSRVLRDDGGPMPAGDLPVERALRGETVVNMEVRFINDDGEQRTIRVNAAPLRAADGTVAAGAALFEDVTELSAARESVRESEERFRSLSACSPLGIFIADAAGNCSYTNAQAQAICGFSLEEALGLGWARFVHPDQRQQVFEAWETSTREGRSLSREFRWQHADGVIRWSHVRSAPMVTDAGKVLGYVGSIEDITERKHEEQSREALIEELRWKTQEAQAANVAKSQFMATISHELRTPLNAILGYTDLVLNGVPEPIGEASRRHLERVVTSSRHLLQLIDQILSFERLSAGREELLLRPIALQHVFDEVHTFLEPLAHKKNLKFIIPDAEPSEVIVSDEQKLKQILVNLLGNAVKFTERGEVVLSYRFQREFLLLQVRDTGIGIPGKSLTEIFEPFRQVDQTVTRRVGGTGLGLTIAKQLARLLGGDVTAVSEPGVGSTFTVSIRDAQPSSML